MKIKNYYWNYLENADSYEYAMTQSELEYHQQNMQYTKPLYKELDDGIAYQIEKLRERFYK